MQSRGLLIGVVALAALSGLLWWSDKKANDEAKNPAKDSKSVKLLSVSASDVVDIVVQHKNEAAVHLLKNVAANKWELVSEPKFLIENDAAMTLATNSGTISSDKLIDDNATDFIQYGLDPAQIAFWNGALGNLAKTEEWNRELTRNLWENAYVNSAGASENLKTQYTDLKAILFELGFAK